MNIKYETAQMTKPQLQAHSVDVFAGFQAQFFNPYIPYQFGRADDRFGYVYIMSYYNGKAMEAFIFSFLEGFRYGDDRRELFHIHLDVLMRFMKVFEHIALDANKMFNDALSKYYDSYHDLEPALHLEEHFGIISEEDGGGYIPPIKYDMELHPQSLTTKQVNDALRPFGMALVGEYTDRCEQQQTF
ncbi:hypothetical protein GQ600_14081 [Phytophthora cactorum]|nr:hypothetical protein GQ600_14081 [Phytophthora cactorum]